MYIWFKISLLVEDILQHFPIKEVLDITFFGGRGHSLFENGFIYILKW